MNSISTLCVTAFLALLSWHIGMGMELAAVTFLGAAFSVLASLKLVTVERPTWGLLFVLAATGGFVGNQVLEDWALEGSWPQENGLGAGLVLSLLLYMIWVFASRATPKLEFALDRSVQTVLVLGMLFLLLIPPPEDSVVMLAGMGIPLFTVVGILLAVFALLADRCSNTLVLRFALLLPLILIVPSTTSVLRSGQGPMIAAIGNLFPTSSNFTPTGFSPYQRLNPSVFLRPSNRAVMRIRADSRPSRYLVGNRLAVLDENLVWQAPDQPSRAMNTFNAELLPTGEWRYPLENNHVPSSRVEPQTYTINSLTSDNFVFLAPGASHIAGRFEGLNRDAGNVWTIAFERGSDRRWQVGVDNNAEPGPTNPDYLSLPAFWDSSLQSKSVGFSATQRQATVDNVVQHFTSRDYALQTNFDPDQPFHDFYLNEKPGYCFWFATATTLALRANDIPSRLVSGYAINEQISDDLWLVRQRDAHSWVEWQDEQGYWHTVDPTPASMTSFFGGYQSSSASRYYHYAAGQWQRLIDAVLADEFTANAVRYGGVLILIFLFTREYRRLRGAREHLDNRAKRWQKLWRRFLQRANLPANPAWTASQYAENLPASWPRNWRQAAGKFLMQYNSYRFAPADADHFDEVEQALENCLKALSQSQPDDIPLNKG